MKRHIEELVLSDDFLFAKVMSNKEIHIRVTDVKQSKEMEVEYMTLFQRDRENIELGREEGHEEGLKLGRAESEKKMTLMKLLLKEGRTKDMERALDDPEYCKELFEEFHI